MRFQVNAGQVISEIIDEEAVMIDLTTGNYYSLNESGAEVWDLLGRGASLVQIVAALSDRYSTEPEEIEPAVRDLVDELRREELIVPAADDGGAAGRAPEPVVPEPPHGSFQPPRLEKHTDMQDLILLDPVHEVGQEGWPHVKAESTPSGNDVSG
jgi:Coenzyme PQQ synthesis protein D (PqqD)